MIALLLALVLQPAPPRPAELRSFGDWIVGCDNGRACQAVGLVTYADETPRVTLTLRRGAEASAEPVILINHGEAGGGSLEADGRRLPVRLIAASDAVIVHPADTLALADAMRSARRLLLRDASGAVLGEISVSGASASMLYIDEQQRRLDNATALVRRGAHPAAHVPPPPPLPEVRLAPAPTAGPAPVSDAQIAALRRQTDCTLEEVGGPDLHETVALEPGKTLVLLACGSGAYNVTYLPFIMEGEGAGARLRQAEFDSQWAMEDLDRPTLINAEWDAERRLLTEFSRGRGLGDCGTKASYGWDGRRFRLVEQQNMDQCQGAVDFITTWRARVVRP
jgi:hypothetical protein